MVAVLLTSMERKVSPPLPIRNPQENRYKAQIKHEQLVVSATWRHGDENSQKLNRDPHHCSVDLQEPCSVMKIRSTLYCNVGRAQHSVQASIEVVLCQLKP